MHLKEQWESYGSISHRLRYSSSTAIFASSSSIGFESNKNIMKLQTIALNLPKSISMNYIPCISHRDRQYSREHQYILVWRFSLNCVKPWSYNINKHINPLCIMAKPWRWTPNRRYLDYASLMVTHGGCLVACVRRTSWCLVACESSRARPARPSKHSGVRPAENSWFSSFHGDRLPREHRERRVRSAAGTRDGVSSKLRREKFEDRKSVV